MKVRFWGTRGSLAKPGPRTVRYGGNTSCVSVETAAGTLLVIDCGTGVHDLGQHLLETRKGPIRGHVLISHTHWDHIQGIPFFAPLFLPGHQWDFYAAQGFGESLRETLAGQMEYTYFPVTPEAFNASVHYHHLGEGSLRIDDVLIRTRYLNHPALTLGFRIEVDGAVLVYACDHEPHGAEAAHGGELSGEDAEHAAFLRGADLVIHDAQYCAAEYPNKKGWGHSTVEYATRVAASAGVKRLALTHHDPLRHDEAMDTLIAGLRERHPKECAALEVFAAAEGMEIELVGTAAAREEGPSALQPAERSRPGPIVVFSRDQATVERVRGFVAGDGIEVHGESKADRLIDSLGRLRAGLLLIDAEVGFDDAHAAATALARSGDPRLAQLPCVVLGAAAPKDGRDWSGVAGWLNAPYSPEYARARLRAFLLRARCRWQVAPLPEDEQGRLEALRALRLLDTPREERFDRFTRMASAMFDMPFAFISLVDAERQWFKSCIGIDAEETSREVSFCAHAIHQRELFVVPDTLLDDRFADNPVVADGPRVRFYAGYPLVLDSGHCIGTLCLADQRPRDLSEEQSRLLGDLGALVLKEIQSRQQAA
ncbi:MBL fold metallo-hydrolase [Pseudomarimonas salicorniae]|uniref:MBL fold metallo-hydrolase n=1 Tax=Pseudomarimonas salicorniae TaxID=2933270 RepID=A0ABT0GDQ7_9GAMM|nr:MBL fold metallo-hydrolase [Lysobacter sp. CAU 1642]MCK7592686.1 MBL fold metallo-hydrolase [Lysobacter sp. CAU 1642]